ncbi:hypothetical protein, partial [Candidatus Magnetobacterium casense]
MKLPRVKLPSKATRRTIILTAVAVVCVLGILSTVFPIPESSLWGFLSIGTSRKAYANPDWLSGWDQRIEATVSVDDVDVNAFATNGVNFPLGGAAISPMAHRYVDTHDRTYISYGGYTTGATDYDLYATYYDHDDLDWATPVKVADAGQIAPYWCPSITVDGAGYIHLFATADEPNYALKHYKSNSTESISAWTAQADIESADATYGWGYPKPVSYGNTLWIFYRDNPSDVSKVTQMFRKSTDNGANWSASQDIIDYGLDTYYYGAYLGFVEANSDASKIYMTWSYQEKNSPTYPMRHVYCAYLNTSDSKMY